MSVFNLPIRLECAEPPVWLECSADGRRLLAMQGPSTHPAPPRALGAVYCIRLMLAVPWRGDLPARRYGRQSVNLTQFNPRAVLAELIAQNIPLAHFGDPRFAQRSLDATCVEGLQTGVGWSLLGYQNVLQIELFYTDDDALYKTTL